MPNAMRSRALLAAVIVAVACRESKPTPLTEKKAEAIIRSQTFASEPVYAEVPQRVSFGPSSPKDDYDEKAIRTLRNLEREGFVTLRVTRDPDGTETTLASVTQKGFPILGTTPSARGPAFRARICEKKLDGVRNFIQHPNDPTVGRAEVVWHYANPNALYPLFETKINKPLETLFVSLASFHWDDMQWKFNIIVRKAEAE